MRTYFFDMDGTFVDLYGVNGWLDDILNENTRPYDEAKPLVNLARLAKAINKVRRNGNKVCIVTWLAPDVSEEYNTRVTISKLNYLKKHLPSVTFDKIFIIPYGTPKQNYCTNRTDVLFDDEERNRKNWTGEAYEPAKIFEVLK